jgi:hypothetical protein
MLQVGAIGIEEDKEEEEEHYFKSCYAEISFDISYLIKTHHRSVRSVSNNYST